MKVTKSEQMVLEESITRQLSCIINYCKKMEVQECSMRKIKNIEKDQEEGIFRFVFEDA